MAEILYIADTTAPDVALMRITGSKLPSALPLADAAAAEGDIVALIGYPAFDDRNDLIVMAQYFRDLYNVKRYAPGRVIQALSLLGRSCNTTARASGATPARR